MVVTYAVYAGNVTIFFSQNSQTFIFVEKEETA